MKVFTRAIGIQILVLTAIFQTLYGQSITYKKAELYKFIENFQQIKLSKIVDKITYISLAGSDRGNLIREISYLDFSQKGICISDDSNCYLFKQNGDFLKKFGSLGKGAGEYTHISGLFFSEDANYIYVSSDLNIYKYLLNGNFLKKIPLMTIKTGDGFTVSIRPWFPMSKNLFLGNIPNYIGTQEYDLIVFDENGNIIKRFKNYLFYNNMFNMENTWDICTSIYKYGESYSFKKLKNDTLFRLTKKLDIYPSYVFSFGRYSPNFKKGFSSVQDFFNEIVNYITLNSIIETKNYFFLTCDFGKYSPGFNITKTSKSGQTNTFKITTVNGVYSKLNDNATFFKPDQYAGFVNDIDGGMNFFPKKVINDSILVSWVDAYQLKVHVASEAFKKSVPKYPEKKKQLEKLANSLHENDNPVLILVKLKD
jgi:hypothetical protein